MATTVVDTFGHIDALIHCAGILRCGGRGPRPMVDLSLEEWDTVINVNLKGTFLCNRAVLPAMIRQRSGHIINLSSTSGIQGRAFDTAYCASKFGVVGLSHSLAEEMRHYGVRVNVILPDAVDTPMWEQNGPLRQPEEALPPARVAELIAFIVGMSDDTMLGDVVIKAFKTRRRKKKQQEE
jgi:NAD(P)-dependent dehydrogenase (short-subunit alcohol dehydrogenase family)